MSTFIYPANVLFCDISGVDIFLKEPYISNEKEIMNAPDYRKKIPSFRQSAPEHTRPEYTLLTHSKVCFVKHTRSLFPSSSYYAWIDFGYPTKTNIMGWPVCTFNPNPHMLNMALLEEKVHLASVKLLDDYASEDDFLACNYFTIFAFSFIIHNDIFDYFFNLYSEKLTQWQLKGHADDEQALLYQLFQENKQLFKIFKIQAPWGLYHENLNTGALNPKILF
jgi:hypothetical protein